MKNQEEMHKHKKKTRNRSKLNFSMETNRLIDMMNMDELMDIWWQMI